MRERLSKGGAIGVLVVALALLPVTPAGAAPMWSIAGFSLNSPGRLLGVSCVSATACTAVGEYGNNSAAFKTLVESWNGKAWSVKPSPSPRGSVLYDVSCVSASWCQAVGSGNAAALIERWDGHIWSIVSSPASNIVPSELSDVSCVSRTFCVAVGGDLPHGATAGATMIESWNGHAWSIVPSPNPGNDFNSLLGVSCVSRVSCQAVGVAEGTSRNRNFVNSTLVESWNGKMWSVVPSPGPKTPYESVYLRGVSCMSAGSCVAVGDYYSSNAGAIRTLIESWNGRAWSIVPSPNRTSYGELNDVSCASATSCQAVGFTNNTAAFRTLTESWNGKAWSMESSPNPTPESALLAGVSCVRASLCTAVGDESLIESFK